MHQLICCKAQSDPSLKICQLPPTTITWLSTLLSSRQSKHKIHANTVPWCMWYWKWQVQSYIFDLQAWQSGESNNAWHDVLYPFPSEVKRNYPWRVTIFCIYYNDMQVLPQGIPIWWVTLKSNGECTTDFPRKISILTNKLSITSRYALLQNLPKSESLLYNLMISNPTTVTCFVNRCVHRQLNALATWLCALDLCLKRNIKSRKNSPQIPWYRLSLYREFNTWMLHDLSKIKIPCLVDKIKIPCLVDSGASSLRHKPWYRTLSHMWNI